MNLDEITPEYILQDIEQTKGTIYRIEVDLFHNIDGALVRRQMHLTIKEVLDVLARRKEAAR